MSCCYKSAMLLNVEIIGIITAGLQQQEANPKHNNKERRKEGERKVSKGRKKRTSLIAWRAWKRSKSLRPARTWREEMVFPHELSFHLATMSSLAKAALIVLVLTPLVTLRRNWERATHLRLITCLATPEVGPSMITFG